MFDLGMTEIFVIAVLAILVIAPKDLPAAMRTVAQTVAKAKRMWRNVQREFDDVLRVDELNEVRRQVADIRRSTDAEFMKSMQAPRTAPRSASVAGPDSAPPAAIAGTDAPDVAEPGSKDVPGQDQAHPEISGAAAAHPPPQPSDPETSADVSPAAAKA